MSLRVVMTVEPPFPGFDGSYEKQALGAIGGDFRQVKCTTEDEVIAAAETADAVICGLEPYTRKVIERLRQCRAISTFAAGYDNIDVIAATEHGICVTNVPDYCVEEVSDHAVALLLACARKILRYDKLVREGKWLVLLPPVFRLRGQVVGLVGLGKIGRAVARKLQGFGVRIVGFDPYLSPEAAKEVGVRLVGFDELLKESDYVSVHAPLLSENWHMFGLEQFRRMKPTAYFINTARGGLVDSQALLTALSEGYIAGAALDVLDIPEPPPPKLDSPLLRLENVIITGHSGYYSLQALEEMRQRPVQEVLRVLTGQWPRCLVNPQVKPVFEAKWGRVMSG